jgi:hypothetical protein
MLDRLASADFSPYVQQVFHLERGAHDQAAAGSPAAPVELQLIEVAELGGPAGPSARRPFSLIFQQTQNIYLPQQIYRITHPVLGQLDLFLVPIGPGQGGMRYQAIFT